MEPNGTDTGVVTLSGFIRYAGPGPLLALATGMVILVLGIRLARRRGPRHVALALFALSWVALLPVYASDADDAVRTFVRGTLRWTDTAMAQVVGLALPNSAALLASAAGLLVGLVGAVIALSRSRGRQGPRVVTKV